MNELTNGATIIVISNDHEYHTLDDWGLAIGNTNYISEPEMETKYIDIPGRDGLLDVSETLSGRPIYKKREINIEVGGLRERKDWDAVISSMRNSIHGRDVKLIFDNDPSYYWKGRIFITNFERARRLGTFTLSIPEADPYKYNIQSSADPWLWDPFNFLTDSIHDYSSIQITGSGTVSIPSGFMPVTPTIMVSNILSTTFTVNYKGQTFSLISGSNYLPEIIVNAEDEVNLLFTGTAKVSIVYRGGSL